MDRDDLEVLVVVVVGERMIRLLGMSCWLLLPGRWIITGGVW